MWELFSRDSYLSIKNCVFLLIEVSFPGDYDKIVLGKKALFLKECSKKLKPIVCTNVEKGSVIVSLKGKEVDMELCTERLAKRGLQLDNFELPPSKTLKSQQEIRDELEEKHESNQKGDSEEKGEDFVNG